MNAWQDLVIAGCQLAFLPAMLPSILSEDKPALPTSIMNMILVFTITFCLGTLHLWFSAFTGTINGLTWTVLAFQKWQQRQQDLAKTATQKAR